jgi:hypothetical protein
MNQLYGMQRERLLSLKKGIAFQKAFMASVERLKDGEIAKRTRLSSGLYSTNIKDWRKGKRGEAGPIPKKIGRQRPKTALCRPSWGLGG